MAHITQLATDAQTFLNRSVVLPIGYRLTLHALDGDVVITDTIESVSPIRKNLRIDLDDNMQQFTASEVRVKLLNEGNIYDREISGASSVFELFRTPILTDVILNSSSVSIPYVDAPFGLSAVSDLVGKKFTISDGKVSWSGEIASVADYYAPGTGDLTGYTLGFVDDFPYEYTIAANNYLEINQLVGVKATLEYHLYDASSSIDEYINAFVGFVARVPDLNAGTAELVLQDAISMLMRRRMYANFAVDKEYTRIGSSTGTLDIDENAVAWSGYGLIAEWQVEITVDNGSYYRFTVTYPDGTTKDGRTDQTWYSDDSENEEYSSLSIPYTDWTGTFDEGDVITVQTYFKQLEDDHMCDALDSILYNALGAYGLYELGYIANNIKDRLPSIGPVAVFKKDTSMLEAVASLCVHLNLSLYTDPDGVLRVFYIQPYLGQDAGDVDNSNDLIDIAINHLQTVPAVRTLYGYDWDTGEFARSYTYPQKFNGSPVEIKCGMFTTEAQAQWIAQFYYAMWEHGPREYEFTEKFNFGVGFSLTDMFNFTSRFPYVNSRTGMLFELEKDLNSAEVRGRALDVQFVWGDYLFLDVGYLDDGKVVW